VAYVARRESDWWMCVAVELSASVPVNCTSAYSQPQLQIHGGV